MLTINWYLKRRNFIKNILHLFYIILYIILREAFLLFILLLDLEAICWGLSSRSCSFLQEVLSILWSYIDILLLPSGGYQTDFFSELYFILLCVLVLLVNYLLSSACWSFTFSSSLGCCFSLNYIIYHYELNLFN